MLADKEKGYVDQFDDYVADLKQFHDEVIARTNPPSCSCWPTPWGHLGPLSGTLAERHPGGGALLPMMGINLGGLPKWLAKGLAATIGTVGGWVGEPLRPGSGTL